MSGSNTGILGDKFDDLVFDKAPGAIFFGDWHGNLPFAVVALERAFEKYPDIEVYYHVGDFGLWPGGDSYVQTISSMLQSAGKLMAVTGGNHEDWDQWDKLTKQQLRPYVYPGDALVLLPKLWYWNHAGETFASVGGASSIDRNWRVPGKSWWIQEGIEEVTVHYLESLSNPKADILITHESSDNPVRPVQEVLNDKFGQSRWPYDSVVESEFQRKYVSRVVDAVQPRYHFHGHWHIPFVRKTEELTTVSLGADFASYEENAFVLEEF